MSFIVLCYSAAGTPPFLLCHPIMGETLLSHPKPKMWEVEKGQADAADLTTALHLGNIMKRHMFYNPSICSLERLEKGLC